MKQTLQLKLSQHLTLTPQLQQSIRLLQLSTLELNAEVERMLQENPLLEKEETEGEDAPPQEVPLATRERRSGAPSAEFRATTTTSSERDGRPAARRRRRRADPLPTSRTTAAATRDWGGGAPPEDDDFYPQQVATSHAARSPDRAARAASTCRCATARSSPR